MKRKLIFILTLFVSSISYSQEFKDLSFLDRSGIQLNIGTGKPSVYSDLTFSGQKIGANFNSRKKQNAQVISKFSYDLSKFMMVESGVRFFNFDHRVQSLFSQIGDTTFISVSPSRKFNALDFPLGISLKLTPKQEAVISILGGVSFTKFWSKDTEIVSFDNLNRSMASSYYLGLRLSTHLKTNWHIIFETRVHKTISDLNLDSNITEQLNSPMSSIGIGYRFQKCN